MDTLLIKLFATALTLSQVTTTPDAVKTHFDPLADQARVVDLLRAGCLHMRKALDIENINIDDLIATAVEDPEGVTGGNAAFRGLDFRQLQTAYDGFCRDGKSAESRKAAGNFDIGAVIDFYNNAVADLPDYASLKDRRLTGSTTILDRKEQRFAEISDGDHPQVWTALADIPLRVQQAFVAAEDRRFYEHRGIDERGLIRAFIANLSQSGRPQGGSTITQQVVKNLLVGDEVSYERKMREMILTVRVEHAFSKDEILELYLNSVYLGRRSWGIEMAARNYFGKSARYLSLMEGALLAGLTKGPGYFSPLRYPERMHERLTYVLGRMVDDGYIAGEESARADRQVPTALVNNETRRDIGFHFVDQVAREAATLLGSDRQPGSYTLHSTIDVPLQRSVEEALQEGLFRYERDARRARFRGAEANLSKAIARLQSEDSRGDRRPPWQRALTDLRMPLYDVHWTPAVLLDMPTGKRSGGAARVGLPDGRVLPLSSEGIEGVRDGLALHDVVFVRLTEGKGKSALRAELRVRPEVQGTVVALENRTGRILAMSGGFSYPLSQLNRATQSQRQPGSAIKPLSYLAALENGLQPNTLIRDEPITFPPIVKGPHVRAEDYWSPRNYGGGAHGIVTLRDAIENSRNLATVHLLDGGIAATPVQSLDRLCALAVELRIYRDCVRFYPFVLGAEPVRPIDLAAFYAAIANEGVRPVPHVVESIERDGETVYRRSPEPPPGICASDRAAFYQLKTMLQGVVLRGTAHSLARLAPYMAGKTGTSENANDAWFVGFTNEVTVAIWVGYDNANGRRTLGDEATGGAVAVPLFAPIIEAVWSDGVPRTRLAPPSFEAEAELTCNSFEIEASESRRHGSSAECLRRDAKGRAVDTRYRLVSRDTSYGRRGNGFDDERENPYAGTGSSWGSPWGSTPSTGTSWGGWGQSSPQRTWQPASRRGGWWNSWW
jgi:membrane carboxypeptidase/penicillin-binding protein